MLMFLSDIVKDFIGEDIKNECKIKLDRENVLGWLKTIDGFANSEGGTFYLGVRDKRMNLLDTIKKNWIQKKYICLIL